MKKYLSIDHQISNLVNNKSVIINDYQITKKYLLLHNYYNFINPVKYHFISGFNSIQKTYTCSYFNDWITINNQNIDLEFKLLSIVLKIEREIRSYLSNYITDHYLSDNCINLSMINEYVHCYLYRTNRDKYINKIELDKKKKWVFKINYDKNECILNAWKNVNALYFSDLIKIISYFDTDEIIKLSNLISIDLCISQKRFNLKELRNHLAHNIPIYFYLNKIRSNKIKFNRKMLLLELLSINNEIGYIKMVNNRFAVIKKYNRIQKQSSIEDC